MASAVTNVRAGAGTDSSLRRTSSSTIQSSAREAPAKNRSKTETKHDKLRAQQKAEAAHLKELIELELSLFKGKGVAKEVLLESYVSVCKGILADEDLDENVLALFKLPYADHFDPGEALLKKLDQWTMMTHKATLPAINRLLSSLTKLTEAALTELRSLPEPSAYAHHKTWRIWQEKDTAILNLRPPTNHGLPIEILHPAFASFLHDIRSMPPDQWAPGEDVNQVSLALCEAMACSFEDEQARRAKLVEQLRRLGLGLQVDFHIGPPLPLETHNTRPGLCISALGTTILLGEIKSEFETGDPYMQVSRSYQALVHHLEDQNRASDGVPCILLVVCGPLLTVAAGFYDGAHIIVEPLTDPCTMLPSRYYRREKRLAQVLSFMRKGIRALSQPSTSKWFPPRTPRIYSTYTNCAGECVGLEFIDFFETSSLHRCSTLLFLARNPAVPANKLLVKLVDPECYGEDVHRALADEGLAPSLLGTARVAGAPSAIIMEYLDASSGWRPLQHYIRTHRETKINTEHSALTKLLKIMKENKVVHGDLRPNNIMCRGTEGQELEIKVIDFDWAGKLGSARYPAVMNPKIKWPGAPRDVIGEDDDENLLRQTLAMV